MDRATSPCFPASSSTVARHTRCTAKARAKSSNRFGPCRPSNASTPLARRTTGNDHTPRCSFSTQSTASHAASWKPAAGWSAIAWARRPGTSRTTPTRPRPYGRLVNSISAGDRCAAGGVPPPGRAPASLGGQARDLQDRPDLDGSKPRPREPARDLDRLVEVWDIDQEVSSKLLARLRERAVGDEALALPHPHARRRGHGLQGRGVEILPGRLDLVRDLRGFPVALLLFGFVRGILGAVHEQHVFHRPPSFPCAADGRCRPGSVAAAR